MNTLNINEQSKTYERFLEIADSMNQNLNTGIRESGRIDIIRPALSKVTLTYGSMLKLIPQPDGAYDVSSMAAITRVFIEMTNKLYFFGLDSNISEEESEFRIELYNYLSLRDKRSLGEKLNIKLMKVQQLKIEKSDIDAQKHKLESLTFYVRQNDLNAKFTVENLSSNKDQSKYFTNKSIICSRGISLNHFDSFYDMFSLFVHSSPAVIDIHRNYLKNYDENSNHDRAYAMVFIDTASRFLAAMIFELKPYVQNWEDCFDSGELDGVCNWFKTIRQE